MKKSSNKKNKNLSSNFVLTAVIIFVALMTFVLVLSKMNKNESQTTTSKAYENAGVSALNDPLTLEAETDTYIKETEAILNAP